MKKKIYNEIEKRCEWCGNGKKAADGIHVLCEHKGIMENGDSCRKYKYNPLLRIPAEKTITGGYSKEDFSL